MLAAAGLPVTVMAAPMIPALNDHELEAILIRACQAGAVHAGYILLRLPLELKDLFGEWLSTDYPDRKQRILSRLRQMRGGELYEGRFGSRMRGRGHDAKLLEERSASPFVNRDMSKTVPCWTAHASGNQTCRKLATASSIYSPIKEAEPRRRQTL